MACKRGLDCDFYGLFVADFADEDYVRVLPENRTKTRGKIKVDFRLDLNLIDAANTVFDRVFNGRNIFAWVFYVVNCRIKRCAFAAAGRPGYDDYAVRLLEHSF